MSILKLKSTKINQHSSFNTTTSNQEFNVNYHYPVIYTEDVFGLDNPLLVNTLCNGKQNSKLNTVFIIDNGIIDNKESIISKIKHYIESYSDSINILCDPKIIEGGEQCKNDFTILLDLYNYFCDAKLDRHSYVIAIGGGAILDLVGYAASTAHRGIRLIRMPTTVLAQNDAGIGVKTGINLHGIKNYIGTFSVPFAVINDHDFLKTLSQRDKRAGLAEAVKVALIRDSKFFDWLETNIQLLNDFNIAAVKYMIRRCAELHSNQIINGGDPFETGNARPLDFGHWAAHKLEQMTKNNLRHGEAVAIGIAIDSQYSVELGLISKNVANRIYYVLKKMGFRLWDSVIDDTNDGQREIFSGIDDFQEHLGGELCITLLNGVGFSCEYNSMDKLLLDKAMKHLKIRDNLSDPN